jgi:hypothetical protein
MGYGFHFKHTNSKSFQIESLAHDSGRTLVRAEKSFPFCENVFVPDKSLSEAISKYQQLKNKSAATALNTVLASAHIQMA